MLGGPDITKLRKTGELSGLPLDGEGRSIRFANSLWRSYDVFT